MKYLVLIISTFCFAQNQDVTLEILNKNLYFYDLSKFDLNQDISNFSNWKLKDSISNFPKNILIIKLTNNSKNKYFFALNDDNLLNESEKNLKTQMQFSIIDNENKTIKPIEKSLYEITTYLKNANDNYCIHYKDSIEESLFLNKDYKYPEKLIYLKKYCFTLYPNESKTLRIVVNFPFSKNSRDNFKYWEYFYPNIDLNKEFYFQLTFNNNLNYILSYYPKENLQEILNNKVIIFNKEIKSNTVKILPR